MSVVISEGQSANVVESDELIASDAVFDLVDPPRRRRSSPWHRFMASVAIWTLYVPHHSVLWLLGPRWGFIWVRIAATIHWSLTFVGAQRPTRRALEQVYPQLGTNLSISQLLRRHLQMKHECFAWVRVYGLHGAKSDTSVRWRVAPECSSTKADIEAHEHGLIFVGYHFGYYQLCAAALSQMIPGCNPVQLRHRIARCAEHAMSPVARLVMYQAIKADRRSGAPIFYFDRETSLRRLYRLLRGGGTLTIAADGMSADDFVDVPFLDGTLRVPIGWARLAAATSSDVVLLFDIQVDQRNRESWMASHMQCVDKSMESAKNIVAEAVRTLEMAIRKEPWAWHPWQRLRWEIADNGKPRYFLHQFGADSPSLAAEVGAAKIHLRRSIAGLAATTAGQPSGDLDPIRTGAPATSPPTGHIETTQFVSAKSSHNRPRLAIVCNSLTPYRVHLHERIVAEIPEVELWSIATHANAYRRWSGVETPASIHPLDFGNGEPTNEQVYVRHGLREWRKGGRIIDWITKNDVSAVLCQGCGDVGRLRILRYCHRRGIPVYLYGDFNSRNGKHVLPKRWLKRLVYGQAVKWSTGLMPCGLRGTELFAKYGGESKSQFPFPFIPDVQKFTQPNRENITRLQHRFGLAPGRRRILFSARMMPAKRPDLAVRAFQAIADERPEWDLVMIGDGELRAEVESQVPANLQSRVKWTGFLHSMDDMAAMYALGDVLLLPSDHEPWGVVVAEAAAAGMAIVASDAVGAAPELVQNDRNGFQFPSGDLAVLIDALRRCTGVDWLNGGKQQSQGVLCEWMQNADPVAGLRNALKSCKLIEEGRPHDGHCERRSSKSLPV